MVFSTPKASKTNSRRAAINFVERKEIAGRHTREENLQPLEGSLPAQ